MILPTRGAAVDTNRRAEIRAALEPDEVVRRIDNLIDRNEIRLTDIFSEQDVHQLCEKFNIEFRERDFTPAITPGLFVSQSLSHARSVFHVRETPGSISVTNEPNTRRDRA